MTKIERLGVVGGGQMGGGIAEVGARAGLDVVVCEVNEDAATAGRARLSKSLDRAVQNGKLTEADRDAALERLRFTTSLSDLADRSMVIEAIAEDEQLKTKLFADLDEVVSDPDAILASNTSSIPIAKLAGATGRPQQVLGVHFFNPVPVLKLVELVPSLLTSEETVERAAAFATEQLGKETIRAKDRSGFVVNACWCRTCCRRSGWSRAGSPAPRTWTRAWCWAAPTRWARCACPTWSAWTRSRRSRTRCSRSTATRTTRRRRSCAAWSTRA